MAVQHGHLAAAAGEVLPLKVLSSAAGFYIGTLTEREIDGMPAGLPFTRESAEYWPTEAKALDAFSHGRWTQRLNF